MKNKIIIVLFSIILFGACEKIDIIETNINYIEKIVVRADLVGGKVFEGITFTKTLPLTETYTIEKAELKEVTAYLKINNAQVIPLHYNQEGIYLPLYELTIDTSTVYELYAEYDGKSIYSRTRVPQTPKIIYAETTNNFLAADVVYNEGEVYGSAWIILTGGTNDYSIKAQDYHSIVGASSFNAAKAFTRTMDIPEQYRTPLYYSRTYIQVFAFDEMYKEFFKTKNNNEPIKDTFAQGGGPINWNVFGENVIGLFIGLTEGQIIRVD
jgi:hypothetical protein